MFIGCHSTVNDKSSRSNLRGGAKSGHNDSTYALFSGYESENNKSKRKGA